MRTWQKAIVLNACLVVAIAVSMFLVPSGTPFWFWAGCCVVAVAGLNCEILRRPPTKALRFLVLAYLISWVIWLIAIALSSSNLAINVQILGRFRFSLSLYSVLAVIGNTGPGVAAIVLCAIGSGRSGISHLLRPLLRWRAGWGWYIFALGLPAALELPVLALFLLRGAQMSDVGPWYRPIRLLLVNLPLAPLWEEIGWRGYLLPELESSRDALSSSLWIGLAWGLWHLPFYVWMNPIGPRPFIFFVWFALSILPLSVLFTLVYHKTGGSLLLVIVFHAALNTTYTMVFGALPQLVPQMYMLTTLFLWIAAAVAFFRAGRDLGLRKVAPEGEPQAAEP